MLVVVASRFDHTARGLVARWRRHHAKLLTCQDLSCAGWRHDLDAPDLCRAVVSGSTVDAREITGILNCLPNVDEGELSHIVEEDRTYVAAEMNAFLFSWMSSMSCAVLNRPGPNCLVGPNWQIEEWILTAARLGIRTRPLRRRVTQEGISVDRFAQANAEVTVVGSHCFGDVDCELHHTTRHLAQAAGVALLSAYFTSPDSSASFVGASLRPDLSRPEVAAAVLEYFAGADRC